MSPRIGVAVMVGLLAVLASRAGRSASRVTQTPKASGEWVDADAPRRIRELAKPIEIAANWPGLGDFLTAVAWTESRGNSQATGDNGTSHGWFQLKRVSSRVEDIGRTVDDIYDEPTSVALAAWYAHRLRPFASPTQKISWLAIRRGWKLPKLVKDVSEVNPLSVNVRENFSEGLAEAGLPQSFMTKRAFPGGYQWPGIDDILQVMGL